MSNEQRKIFARAQLLLRDGDIPAAIKACEAGLGRYPDDGNLACLAARAHIAGHSPEPARKFINEALAAYPDFALAHDVHGDLLLVEGKPQDAVDAWQESLRLDASSPTVREKIERVRALQVAHGDAGHHEGSTLADAERIQEAIQFEKNEEFDKAETIYRDILKSDPGHVEASRLLAGIAARHEQFSEAEVFLKRAVELSPDYARAWVDLANVQQQLEDFDAAIESAGVVLRLAPDQPESHMLYAGAVGAAGRHEEAIAAYRKTLELAPDKAVAMSAMANHLKTLGRQDEAIASYRAALAVRETHAESYWSLANLKTFRFSEDEIAAMHELLSRESLADEAKIQVHNALGFEYEARKDYPQAFRHFEHCNELRRRHESYDPVDSEQTTDRVIEMFDATRLSGPAGPAVTPTPIFVVGLPRSGSTLIEQILASHSQVEGTHELHDLSKVIRAIRRRTPGQVPYPEILRKFRAGAWERLGRQYIDSTARHRSGAAFFIDKNPNNFIFAGVIRMSMPNAKIINARRHPLDSCLGSYKQLFASGQPFSYDLTELGEYYLQYQRLMDHWHEDMPGFVLDVQYEDVVANLEREVRRMLDFCGLPFESACLDFHATERAVKTASSEQVRRPIYSTSVDLWRHYEEHLGELIEVLQPLLVKPSA